ALAILGRICEFHRFDLADLQQLRPDSTLLQGVGAVPQSSRKLAPEAIRMDSCPYLELPSTWTELAARFGKKMRSNLGYYDRLLVRDYPDTTIYLCDESTLGQGMNDLFELHQQRWKSRLMPGVMGSKKAQRFHRMVAERFLACGWLRLHITNSGNKAVAALYCFSFHGRYYYYLGGFAPELGKYSLGTTLTMHAIQQSITEKCKEFDFLRGNEPYKYRWLPEERLNERLLLSNLKGVKSRLLRKLNDWEREIEHRAKEFAEKRGRKG
ncbi:MAG: GNAT family N-acetyltransferase, partial [Chthonomonadales bacterium]